MLFLAGATMELELGLVNDLTVRENNQFLSRGAFEYFLLDFKISRNSVEQIEGQILDPELEVIVDHRIINQLILKTKLAPSVHLKFA